MKRWIIGAGFLLAVAAAGAAYATIPSGNAIDGCYGKLTGILRVVDTGTTCTRFENPISWSQRGPQGVTGATGPAGPPGQQGPQGASPTYGPGLERIQGGVPPFDFDQVRVAPAYLLPQGCGGGAAPVKAATGPGWACGSGGASNGGTHAYVARQTGFLVSLGGFSDTEVVSITVPPGSYVFHAKAQLRNDDSSSQKANCDLSTGDSIEVRLGPIFEAGEPQSVALLDAATFADETTVRMTCATFNGAVAFGVLTAISVGGIN